jgi:hypothetical protein
VYFYRKQAAALVNNRAKVKRLLINMRFVAAP